MHNYVINYLQIFLPRFEGVLKEDVMAIDGVMPKGLVQVVLTKAGRVKWEEFLARKENQEFVPLYRVHYEQRDGSLILSTSFYDEVFGEESETPMYSTMNFL